jgi:hypothetical protein
MSLLSIVILLIVVGIILYAINAYIPMDATIKKILNIVVVVVVVIYLLKVLGAFAYLGGIKI